MTLERSGWRLCVVERNPEAKKPRAIAVGFFWFLHVEQKNACEYINVLDIDHLSDSPGI